VPCAAKFFLRLISSADKEQSYYCYECNELMHETTV
jgi:hypothetical protein